MPTYLTPGVYVEEIDGGSKPIAAVGTAVAAFVGFTAKAPTDDPDDPQGVKPRLVTNWAQYVAAYGGFTTVEHANGDKTEALLPHSVYGFFNNGGGNAYIVRIPHRKMPQAALPASDDEIEEPAALEFTAFGTGAAAKGIKIDVTKSEEGEKTFNVYVKREGEPDDKPLEAFEDLTLAEGGHNVVSRINGVSQHVTVGSTSSRDAPCRRSPPTSWRRWTAATLRSVRPWTHRTWLAKQLTTPVFRALSSPRT